LKTGGLVVGYASDWYKTSIALQRQAAALNSQIVALQRAYKA
jgi:hypothetical protein